MEPIADLPHLECRLELSVDITRALAEWPDKPPFLVIAFSIKGIPEAGIVCLFYWRSYNLQRFYT